MVNAIDRCNCEDWKEGIGRIIFLESFARKHNMIDNDYKGNIMQYCAWCGKKLKETSIKSKEGIYSRDRIIGSVGDKTLVRRSFFIKKKAKFSQSKLIWINKKNSEDE